MRTTEFTLFFTTTRESLFQRSPKKGEVMAPKDICGQAVRRANELLVVTRNDIGTLARISTSLAMNNINIECFTAYEWNSEAAFRFITNNNKKAKDTLTTAGFNVQESTVALWETANQPGRLRAAATTLAEARINTHCVYATAPANSPTQTLVFNTNDCERTVNALNKLG